MDITTEVFKFNRNPEREYCLNEHTVSKISIKDH